MITGELNFFSFFRTQIFDRIPPPPKKKVKTDFFYFNKRVNPILVVKSKNGRRDSSINKLKISSIGIYYIEVPTQDILYHV